MGTSLAPSSLPYSPLHLLIPQGALHGASRSATLTTVVPPETSSAGCSEIGFEIEIGLAKVESYVTRGRIQLSRYRSHQIHAQIDRILSHQRGFLDLECASLKTYVMTKS